MTIYFAETTVAEQRELLCVWTERFYMERKPVQILVDSLLEAQSVDQLLWTFSQSAFIPHIIFNREDAAPAEPVLITPGEFRVPGFETVLCDRPADFEFMCKFETAVHFIMRDDEERRGQSRVLWQRARAAGADPIHVPHKSPPR